MKSVKAYAMPAAFQHPRTRTAGDSRSARQNFQYRRQRQYRPGMRSPAHSLSGLDRFEHARGPPPPPKKQSSPTGSLPSWLDKNRTDALIGAVKGRPLRRGWIGALADGFQWYVSTKPLASRRLLAVGRMAGIQFVPKAIRNMYFSWNAASSRTGASRVTLVGPPHSAWYDESRPGLSSAAMKRNGNAPEHNLAMPRP